jgi:large subunit ribosomal protein L15
MMIHEITPLAGKYKARKRVGRGRASGVGKTSGRGHKGAGSRAGYSRRHQFEGGQMPLFRRLAKRGFTNARFTTHFWIVNLGSVVAHPSFASGGRVDAEALIAAGLIRDTKRPVKILGDLGPDAGTLSVKLEVAVDRVSDAARRLITDAGGSVTESGTRRDVVRGVDRNSDDRSPKNLTKKPKRRAAKTFDEPKPGGKKKDADKKGGEKKAKGQKDSGGEGKSKPKKDAPAPEAKADEASKDAE